jgi:cell division control protein 24
MLQDFKKAVEERGVIGGDAIHDIFHNLNALLDFQRRFLIRVEQTNLLREEDQNWGSLFTLYRDAFMVYEPYISNQKKCEETAMREFDKLREIDGTPTLRQFVENPTVLSAFLLKPFQRLSKYPLLLKVCISTSAVGSVDLYRNCVTRETTTQTG